MQPHRSAAAAHRIRASAARSVGRLDLAVRELLAGLKEAPDDASAHCDLAQIYAELGRLREAEAEARRAAELAPDSGYVAYSLGWILRKCGLPGPALAAARRAIQLAPHGPDNHVLLSMLHSDRKRWAEALESVEEAARLSPLSLAVAHQRIAVLQGLGRTPEAEAEARRALALTPNDKVAHHNAGWVALKQSEPERARGFFLEALRIDPTFDQSRVGVEQAIREARSWKGALMRACVWLSPPPSRRGGWAKTLFYLQVAPSVVAAIQPDLAAENELAFRVAGAVGAAALFGIAGNGHIYRLVLSLDPLGRQLRDEWEFRGSQLYMAALPAALVLGAAGISRVTLAVAASGWIASVSFTALRVGQLTVRRHRRLGVLALVSSIIVAGATGWLGLGGRIEPRWAPFLVLLAFVLAISVIYLPAKKPRSDGKLRV